MAVNTGTVMTAGTTQLSTTPGVVYAVGAIDASVELRDGGATGTFRWIQDADTTSPPLDIGFGSAINVIVAATGTASISFVSSG